MTIGDENVIFVHSVDVGCWLGEIVLIHRILKKQTWFNGNNCIIVLFFKINYL